MASFFISHSSQDQRAADDLHARLRGWGFSSLFLDVHTDDGIPVGADWEQELYAQLRSADAVIFLGSPAAVASRWCFAELALARSSRKPVFPLWLGGDGRSGLLAGQQWLDVSSGDRAYERLRRALKEQFDPRVGFYWDRQRSPYPGLKPFQPEDAAMFFGREDKVDEMLRHLDPGLGHGRSVAVIGPSGSGKSSVVRAGVIPRLRRASDVWAVVPPFTPGEHPIAALSRALAMALQHGGQELDRRKLEEDRRDLQQRLERDPHELIEAALDIGSTTQGTRRAVLLVIDQAEELVSLAGPEQRERFVTTLRTALDGRSPLWIVTTLRTEFLGSSLHQAAFDKLIHEAVLLGPLDHSRLFEVIEGPARKAGIEFESGLVPRMVEDTRGGDALPLLAYTLRQLTEGGAATDRLITHEEYVESGGVLGTLETRANAAATRLEQAGQSAAVLPTLLKFTTLDAEGEPTRRRLQRTQLNQAELEVAEAFVEERLLVSDGPVIEVAHEALLRTWRPLRDAIAASRTRLRVQADLAPLARAWHEAGRQDAYLLRDEQLHDVRAALAGVTNGERLEGLEGEYYAASVALERRLREAERLRRRRITLTRSIVFVVISGAALISLWQSGVARNQTRLALSRQLAIQAEQLVDTRPETAILAGLQSMSLARDQRPEPQPPAALVTGLARGIHTSRPLLGHAGSVNEVVFSHDGGLLASASHDGTVRLWEVASGRPYGQPLDHGGYVNGVAFSPDGRLLASAGDGPVRLWDVASGQPHGQPLAHTDVVNGVAFSSDGGLLASAGDDGAVRLWEVASGRLLGQLLASHTSYVSGVAFSPDGELLASAGGDRSVRLWEVASGQPHGQPLAHSSSVRGVAFSSDGTLLASASMDGSVRLWEVASGRPHGQPLAGHIDEVNGVAFSPDGRLLASASSDRSVRLWEVASGQLLGQPLASHTSYVSGVAFSRDGELLASAGGDGSVRLWEVASSRSHGQPLTGHTDEVNGVAFSSDGGLLASAGDDGAVRLWEVASGRPHGQPLAHTDEVNGVAFSSDGRLLASASNDGTVRLWEVASGRPHGQHLDHGGYVNGVAFSRDGTLLASAGGPGDGPVRLWEVASGRPHGQPLTGHIDEVNGVAFSRDGKALASASDDRTVRLWEVASGRPHGQPLDHGGFVSGVAFSPDGTLLASASADRTVRLWNPSFTSWVDAGCRLVNRNLSMEEWEQLLPDQSYERTCPDLPSGQDAPSDAPVARYQESLYERLLNLAKVASFRQKMTVSG